MTAALRQDIPDRRSPRRAAYKSSALPNLRPLEPRRSDSPTHPTPINPADLEPQIHAASAVTALPQPRPLPSWLKLLMKVQQGSTVMTLLLMGTVLAIYGWTVFTQQRWGQEYRRWGALQKHEQQLMATNEVLKNQMAQQAENPKSGFVAPDPSSMIFLAPAAPRPAVQPDIEAYTPEPIPNKPLGY